MPDADGLPPVSITDWQNYQSDQFGQTTDAMLATLPSAPPSSDSLTNPLGTGNAAPDSATPPAPILPDLAPATPSPPVVDASAQQSPPVAAAVPPPAAAPAPAVAPAPTTATTSEDLSPVLNAASAAGIDPAVFIAAHQTGNVDPSNFFDQATQLAGHIKDAGGDLVKGLAAFTGSATNAAKVLDKAVANLNPTPAASSSPSGTTTTAPVDTSSLPTQVDSSSHQAFITSAAPIAQAWAAKTGIPAEYFLAANASESNWGKAPGNELFGIKAPGNAGSQNLATWEQQGGQHVDQTLGFGAYKTPNDAYQAFVDLISNTPRYANAWAQFQQDHDPAKLFQGLNKAGYATDPNWGSNIASIAHSIAPNIPNTPAPSASSASRSSAPPIVADASDRAAASQLSQFGDKQLSTDEAYAACGPAAAVRFAEAEGRNPTLREATDLAKTVGWTSASGMAGLSSEKALMDKLGIPTKVVNGAAWDAFSREAQTGNPVTISTAGHYFYADGYNPDTGAFHVGQSGLDLKGGSEWMTPAQMTDKMGAVQGGLLADNPTIANPSTVTGSAGQNQPADPVTVPLVSPATSNQTPSQAGNSTLDWLGRQKDQIASTIGNTASGVGTAVSGAVQSVTGPQPMTAAMQPTPSDTLTNPTLRTTPTDMSVAPPAQPTVFDKAGNAIAANQANPPLKAVGDQIANSGANQIRSQIFPNILEPNHPLNQMQMLMDKYGTIEPSDAMTPEDRIVAQNLGMAVGGMEMPAGGADAVKSLVTPGPARALTEARQAVADLAAKFPQMSPGSLAASAPGKNLAILEADAAANPDKYAALLPNATRARATAADTQFLQDNPAVTSTDVGAGSQTRDARLLANDPNAGAEPPIGNEPFTRDPQGNIVAAPAPQDANATLTGLINQAKAKGFDTSALEAQLPTPAVSSAAEDAPPLEQFDAQGNPVNTGLAANPSQVVRPDGLGTEPGWQTIPGRQGGAVDPSTASRPSLLLSANHPPVELPSNPDATEPFGHTAISRSGITPETVQIAHQRIDTALGNDPGRADLAHNELDQMLASGAAPDEVTRFLSGDVEGHTVSPTSILRSVRTGSMAGGLTTMGKVAIGPVVQVAMRAPVAAIKAVVAGRAGDIPTGLQGGLAGLAEGSQDALQTLRYGTNYRAALTGGAQGGYGFAPGLDVMGSNVAKRAIGTAAVGLVRTHGAVADITSGIGRGAALATGATPEVAGETGQQWALRSGNYGTIGQAVSDALEGLKRTNPTLNVVGQILVPFYRVGYNAFTQGVERSPVGLVGTGADVARGALGKGPYAAGADASHVTAVGDRLANNLFGVGLAGVGLAEAAQGNITGENPQNNAPKWSVRVAGQWLPLRTLGPAGEALAQSAILYESARNGKGNIPKTAETAAAAYVGHVNDETWLRSLGDTFSTLGAVKNLASAKSNTATSASKELAYQAGSIGKSFIPQQALGSQIVKAITGTTPGSAATAPVRSAVPPVGRYQPKTSTAPSAPGIPAIPSGSRYAPRP